MSETVAVVMGGGVVGVGKLTARLGDEPKGVVGQIRATRELEDDK